MYQKVFYCFLKADVNQAWYIELGMSCLAAGKKTVDIYKTPVELGMLTLKVPLHTAHYCALELFPESDWFVTPMVPLEFS